MELYHDLLAQGITKAEIARKVRTKQIVRLRRGAFVAPGRPASPEARHLDLIAGTLPVLSGEHVLSHGSAAVLHGLPVPATALGRVHTTRATSGRVTRHLHRHPGSLPAEAVTEIHGYAVTSLPRTVVDLARWLAYADGVAVVDAGLRLGVTADVLDRELRLASRRPGNQRARLAVDFGDARAESPGESRSRVLMAEVGLPMPTLQREFFNPAGELDARVDFDWERFGVCGEYDGETKYGRLLQPGQSVEQVIRFEKQREEVLRQHGRWMVRWGRRELRQPDRFRQIIETALYHGPRARRRL